MKTIFRIIILLLLVALSHTGSAQSYHAPRHKKLKHMHAKQHGVKVLWYSLKQKKHYARKRRQILPV
jgi:hypothetical protein